MSVSLSIRPSVCPSICQTRELWQNERNLCPQSYTTWKNVSLSFPIWRIVGCTWNFWPNWPRSIARSASAVTPSKKVQLTLIGSSLRAFQRSQDEHRTLPLSPPKGTQKRKTAVSKIVLHLKKVCYKVSLCENHQSCKTSTGLSIRVRMVCGDIPYYVKIWPKPAHSLQKRRFPINIHS